MFLYQEKAWLSQTYRWSQFYFSFVDCWQPGMSDSMQVNRIERFCVATIFITGPSINFYAQGSLLFCTHLSTSTRKHDFVEARTFYQNGWRRFTSGHGKHFLQIFFAGDMVLLAKTQLSHYSANAAIDKMQVDGCVCANKTLFTQTREGRIWPRRLTFLTSDSAMFPWCPRVCN